jgi:tartrate-resistant acid phosphatase type 5
LVAMRVLLGAVLGVCLSLQALAADPGLSFVTLGDWGGAALGGDSAYAPQTVSRVAQQMEKTMTARHARFVVNTGDNFYWCGIQNTSDFQIETDWVEPYRGVPQVPWYGSLGNHEYGYSVEAQLQLGETYPNWILPSRYYSKRLQLEGPHFMSLIVLDSSPCVSEYRSSDPKGWDPCSTQCVVLLVALHAASFPPPSAPRLPLD